MNNHQTPGSILNLEFVLSGQEIKDTLLNSGSSVEIPIPQDWAALKGDRQKTILDKIFNQPEVACSIQQIVTRDQSGPHLHHVDYPSIAHATPGAGYFIRVSRTVDNADFDIHALGAGQNDSIAKALIEARTPQIYFFNAQRYPRPTHPYGNNKRLIPNADNLVEVLGTLQPSATAFKNYVHQVRQILPLIKWISVEAAGGNETEIRIWQVEEATGRNDLTIPLSQCGTGVGQVLAILYVVTQSSGNVIVIDEPTSFLHPHAAKALMKVLREDRNNQYIVSTHSPEVIVAIDPARLFALNFEQEATTIKNIDRRDLDSARNVLDALGSRLSDVFGADQIAWVEGPTEVECFPLLLKAANVNVGANLAFAALRATGDLEGRHAEAIADIYRNLSASHAILPRTLTLSLDGDKRAQLENSKILKSAFGDVLHFLPRRCYENYLLDASALSSLLNELPFFVEHPTNDQFVRSWIEANGGRRDFCCSAKPVFSDLWMAQVDGATLLEELFQHLSEGTEIYRKTLHSPRLTKWLLEHKRTFLEQLIAYVVGLIPPEQRLE